MEEKKITFAVDDVNIVSENPDSNFAILSLDFFSSGINKHNLIINEDVLMRTSETIRSCPLVWKYDPVFRDASTHCPEETPCGFVPPSAEITSRELSDGRIMLSANAYLWKKYTGSIYDIFKEGGGKRPVSVEISVFDEKKNDNGIIELLDYKFDAVTILGELVSPAIDLAQATVMQFAEEYKHDYELEFGSYESLDFTIPSSVKKNAEKGLSLYKQYGRGGNSISLSIARHLQNSEKSNFNKIKHIAKVFSGKRFDNQDKKEPSNSYINFLLYGGKESIEWAKDLNDRINEQDSKNLAYFSKELTFPYDKRSDMNPSLRGINPPITAKQGEEIARQVEAIGVDKEKNGWAISISAFKKSHVVKDGKWVKKEESDKKLSEKEEEKNMKDEEKDKNKEEEMAVEEKTSPEKEEDKKEEMAVESPEEKAEKKEEDKEKKEHPEEEKKETKKEEKMSNDINLDVKAMLAFLADETEKYKEIESEFSSESGEKNFAKLCGFMYEKMSKMFEENKTYMAENEKLKEFKSNVEKEQKEFEVKSTLKEVENSMPKEEMESLYDDSANFSLENIGVWQNKVRAKAFSFVKGNKPDNVNSDIMKMALPFVKPENKTGSVWK